MVTLDAITFDLDDTLWDNQGVMLKTEEGHYRWLLEALAAWRAARQEAPLPLTYDGRGGLPEAPPAVGKPSA